MAGTAVGFMLMPQAVQLLLTAYGFSGSVLVLSGISMHAVVGAALLQPVEWHIKATAVEMGEVEIHLLENKIEVPNGLNKPSTDAASTQELCHVGESVTGEIIASSNSVVKNGFLEGIGSNQRVTKIDREEEEDLVNKNLIQIKPASDVRTSEPPSRLRKQSKSSIWQRIFIFMDFDLLKDPIYLNIVCGTSIFFVAEVNFKMIVPFFMSDLGYTKSETAFCLSIMAVSDIVARVVLPPICDRFAISRRMLFLIAAILLGISRSILAEQTSYVALLVTISVSGLFRGATLINFNLSVSEYCPLEKLAAAIGLSMVTRGIFIVVLGPVVGAIRDYSDSYPVCIHFQTLLIFVCCMAWTIEFMVVKWRKPKEINQNID